MKARLLNLLTVVALSANGAFAAAADLKNIDSRTWVGEYEGQNCRVSISRHGKTRNPYLSVTVSDSREGKTFTVRSSELNGAIESSQNGTLVVDDSAADPFHALRSHAEYEGLAIQLNDGGFPEDFSILHITEDGSVQGRREVVKCKGGAKTN